MSNIPTPHNACDDASLIAKTVLMPGDPLRAKFIADTFLTDVVEFTHVRNVLGYTGYYNKKRISVMASGMGMPSIGIYSYELYNFYGVENIVRVGSAGSFDPSLKLYDTLLVTEAFAFSNYAKVGFGIGSHIMKSTKSLNTKLTKAAEKLGIPLIPAKIYSSDVFYGNDPEIGKKLFREKGCQAVEMESFALFTNAKVLGKKAACLLTISDTADGQLTTAIERQNSFTNMMKIALELAAKE